MKVLILVPELDKPGGVSTYYASLRQHLDANIEYFTRGLRKHDRLLSGIVTTFRDWIIFSRQLEREKYDIIHINTSLGLWSCIRDTVFILTAKHKGFRVIVFFRGWNHRFATFIEKHLLCAFHSTFFRADAAIVLANEFKSKLLAWGFKKPIFLETTAVDDSIIETFSEDSLLKKHKTSTHDVNILFLAHFARKKGLYEVVEAYSILCKRYTGIDLLLCGNGPLVDDIQEYISENSIPNVTFGGYVNGVLKSKAFTKADIYILPTYTEGMPNSVLEAMAFGLPVVTRYVGGLRDFFVDGQMGFITESFDPSVFANLMQTLIRNPDLRKQIALYNHNYAMNRFLASKVARRLMDIYLQIINQPN